MSELDKKLYDEWWDYMLKEVGPKRAAVQLLVDVTKELVSDDWINDEKLEVGCLMKLLEETKERTGKDIPSIKDLFETKRLRKQL